jgi:Flp pilus assembly protein TadB
MTALILAAGAAFGAGLVLIYVAVRPAPASLSDAVARLHAPRADTGSAGWRDRLSRRWLTIDARSRTGRDLTAAGVGAEVHAGRTVAGAGIGLVAGPMIAAAVAATGVGVAIVVPVWLALTGSLIGAAVPQLALRRAAAQRRREFRHALGAYLDLLAMLLAADEGIEGALHHAAEVGDGWPFDELRRALRDARTRGAPMWEALETLGDRLDIVELREVAAAAGLGGSQGASVRRTLMAKARSLRSHALSGEETDARNRSKQMAMPLMAIAVAFLLFLFYPALAQLTSS